MAHQNDLLYSTSIPPCILHQCRICGWMVPAEKPMKEKTLRQLLLKDLNKWYSDLFDTDRKLYFRIRGLLILKQGITCGHKESDPNCPCFHDGFITCDAEKGYNHYEEWQRRVWEEIEMIIEPTSDLKGDDLMHYEEGYADATEDILKLLK